MRDKFIKILLFVWQFPQIALGYLLAYTYYRPANHTLFTSDGVRIHYSSKMRGGVSFGGIIIVNANIWRKDPKSALKMLTVRHELGHCVQSRLLGWLYLPVVGICSLVHAVIYQVFHKCDYYHFWVEAWADRIAGIKR